jgi:hypothetical protein
MALIRRTQFSRERSATLTKYDALEMADVDDVMAIARVDGDEDDVLAHLFRCKMGTLRYTDALSV